MQISFQSNWVAQIENQMSLFDPLYPSPIRTKTHLHFTP